MRHEINPSQWWNPIQWFAIIFSLWTTQFWYWLNVRPRLNQRKFGWSLVFQASLGILIIEIVILFCASAALFITDSLTIDWQLYWVAQIFLTFLTCFVFTFILGHHVILPLIVLLLPPLSIVWILENFIRLTIIHTWPALLISCGLFGFAAGVIIGVLEGNLTWSYYWIAVIMTVAFLGAFIENENQGFLIDLVQNAITIGLTTVSVYLGLRWAIRTPKDEEQRKQLANPFKKMD